VNLVFNACKKSEITTEEQGTGSSMTKSEIIELLRDRNDAANDRINMILLHYTNAVQTCLANPNIQPVLLDYIDKDTLGFGVSLRKIALENQVLGTMLNATLKESIAQNDIYPLSEEGDLKHNIDKPDWNANDYLASKMLQRGILYEPVVYFHRTGRDMVQPRGNDIITAIAEEVNNEDEVIAFKKGKSFLLDEKSADQSEDVILFIGVGENYTFKGKPTIVDDSDTNDPSDHINKFVKQE
jgi:hypothetical protein